jgi:hypothetical protein
MTQKEQVQALVAMLLAFRAEPHLTEVIDQKLKEICPDVRDEVEGLIRRNRQ